MFRSDGEHTQLKIRLLGPWHVCLLVWKVIQKGRQTSDVLSQTLIYSVMLHASTKITILVRKLLLHLM